MRGDDKRSAVIAAVWQVIARSGITAVSFRTVAATAGVSVGSVQHHFGSKEELVRASAAAMIEGAANWHAAAAGTPRQALHRVVAHVIPTTPGARTGLTVWFGYAAACATDPVIADHLAAARRGQERTATALLDTLSPTRTDANPDAARRLIAIADGLALRVLIGDLSADEALAVVDRAMRDVLDDDDDADADAGQV